MLFFYTVVVVGVAVVVVAVVALVELKHPVTFGTMVPTASQLSDLMRKYLMPMLSGMGTVNVPSSLQQHDTNTRARAQTHDTHVQVATQIPSEHGTRRRQKQKKSTIHIERKRAVEPRGLPGIVSLMVARKNH